MKKSTNIFMLSKLQLIIARGTLMTISEQIKVLCVRSNISVAELARRMGTTPQNFNSKLKRESFTISDLEYLAETIGCSFERHFILPDGDRV